MEARPVDSMTLRFAGPFAKLVADYSTYDAYKKAYEAGVAGTGPKVAKLSEEEFEIILDVLRLATQTELESSQDQ